MPLQLELSDLTRLDKIQRTLAENDSRQQFATLGMDRLVIDDEAMDRLVETVSQQLERVGKAAGRDTRVHLVADAVQIRREGRDLKDTAFGRLAERFNVKRVTLDDGHPTLHADEAVLDAAAAACAGADCIVSVGGGTITDVAKIAAMRGAVPVHVVVQTAASVDGFTDNFSVVLQKGVKRTLLTRWPDAVLTDIRTLAEAPHALNAAGFGELLSMFVAPGDWLIASKLGIDTSFTTVLVDMLAICGAGVETWAASVGERKRDGVSRLASALAMRGIVTGVGGTSASLSGMEHLVSHILDMYHAERGEPIGLHGAQVGVGSVIAAAAWEVFCERMTEAPLDSPALFGDIDASKDRVLAAFGELDPTGRLGGECWGHYRQKLVKWNNNRDAVTAFFANWNGNRTERDAITLSSETIATCLHQARAPKRFTDLEPAPSAELMRWAVTNCPFMRERFTVADLLVFAGWWDDAGVSRVLDRVETVCATAEAKGA